jgi:hypothetical protein
MGRGIAFALQSGNLIAAFRRFGAVAAHAILISRRRETR